MLAPRGLLIRHHLEANKVRQWDRPLPRDVDVVIGLKDFMGHPEFWKLRAQCKSMGVPLVLTLRKKGNINSALWQRGLVKLPEVPLEVASTTVLQEVEVSSVANDEPTVVNGTPLTEPSAPEPEPLPPPVPPEPLRLVAPPPPAIKWEALEQDTDELQLRLAQLSTLLRGVCYRLNTSVMVTPDEVTIGFKQAVAR